MTETKFGDEKIFSVKLKCGRKGCGRTLGTMKVRYTIGRDFTWYLQPEGDTHEWLHVSAQEGIPFSRQAPDEYAPAGRFKLACRWEPQMYSGSVPVLAQQFRRGRDLDNVRRRGCGADHTVKRSTLERIMLEKLGIGEDQIYHPDFTSRSTMIDRYKASMRHWEHLLA